VTTRRRARATRRGARRAGVSGSRRESARSRRREGANAPASPQHDKWRERANWKVFDTLCMPVNHEKIEKSYSSYTE